MHIQLKRKEEGEKCKGKRNFRKGNHRFCSVTLAEVSRKLSSTLVEERDCGGFRASAKKAMQAVRNLRP